MTANGSLERRVAEYYATEPPLRAPDRVLLAALSSIDITPQRRGIFAPWRFIRMSTYAKLATAAIVVVAATLGAVGLLQVDGPGGPPAPTPSAKPSPSPQPSATPIPTPVAGTAAMFVVPFDYILPARPSFDFGTTNQTYFEVRVPEWNDAGHAGGLIVQAIGGGRTDPCDPASTELTIEPGPQAVFDYLKTVPGMSVTNESATTVDGRPARQASVIATPGTGCPTIWAWMEDTEPFIAGIVLRLVAFDLDGEHVVITIFGEPGNPEWPAMADEVMRSFQFRPVAASPSAT